jgi:cation diffusion facilitator family transporter
MAASRSSKTIVYAALAGNFLVAITKFIAAAWTGSSAMLSEGVHSLVDTSNQVVLLYGIHRAAQPADERHPFGHGRELYFWSFIVALLIFSLGAGISFYEGVVHMLHPVVITSAYVNYIVLGASAVFEGGSWFVAFREFERERGNLGYVEAATRSKDPTSFIVLFEDSAALIGLAIAFIGTFLAQRLEAPILDGLASIGIGIVLAATAVFLAPESKGLLLGEPARESVRKSLLKIVAEEPGVEEGFNLITVHMGPDQIVVAIDLEFSDDLSVSKIEQTVHNLEQRMRERHPEVIAVFIKPKERKATGGFD